MKRTNIRIYSYDIFRHEQISEYIRIKILIRTNIRIHIWIGNIRIFEYICHTLDKTGTSSVLLQFKFRYIRIQKIIRTNIRINIWIENIRIFKYIRHTLD